MAKIAVIPGDGVGVEVMKEARRVLDQLNSARKLNLEFENFDFGAERYLKTGVGLPAGQIDIFREQFDAILFGAVGDARVKDQAHAREILLGLRFGLDLYVNFRPCQLLHERLCPLKDRKVTDVDFVVFRENTEGMYNAIGGQLRKGTPDEVAIAEEISTRKGVERIIRAAFEWAKANGKKRVALADKSNAIGAHELWVRTFKEVAVGYSGIEAKHYYVDNLAMQLVQSPQSFDVIVTTNLFGDILTDLGASLCGGLGFAASGNLNPDSTPLFEPVHGSAPDIAGQGKVNPSAMFLTCGLMLETLGFPNEARQLKDAVRRVVERGISTPDAGGKAKTSEVSDAVLAELSAR